MKDSQRGFSMLEAVAAVVVLGVIGVAMWFVYQHTRPASAGVTGGTQTAKQQTTTTKSTYLTISEWGIRAPYAGSLKLSYTVSADGNTAWFSSDKLSALSSECAGRGGSIFRWLATDTSDRQVWERNQAAEDYLAGKSQTGNVYAHIGVYYYVFVHDQAACGDPSVTATTQSQTNDTVKALVPVMRVAVASPS